MGGWGVTQEAMHCPCNSARPDMTCKLQPPSELIVRVSGCFIKKKKKNNFFLLYHDVWYWRTFISDRNVHPFVTKVTLLILDFKDLTVLATAEQIAQLWLFVLQIQDESITSRFWLSVKLEMDIRQTKQSARRGVCVSAASPEFIPPVLKRHQS